MEAWVKTRMRIWLKARIKAWQKVLIFSMCIQTQRLNTNSNATDGYFDDGEANADESGDIFIKVSKSVTSGCGYD